MLQKYTSAIFIIIGLLSLVFYFIIPDVYQVGKNIYSLSIIKNLLSAIGSLFIVGGIFEISFKHQFIKEVSENFVKTLFLDKQSLVHFSDMEIEKMRDSLQHQLLKQKTDDYSSKMLNMINQSFFKMLQGKHTNNNFNAYYNYYNSNLYVKERINNSCFVEIEYVIKYELINNTEDLSEVSIFSKRFFPLHLSQSEHVTQELIELKITSDGILKNYNDDIKKNSFREMNFIQEENDSVKIQEDIKRQIQIADEDNNMQEFKVKYKKTIIVEKTLKIVTMYNDVTFSHIFKRPTMNFNLSYQDENVNPMITDYLTLKLFSGISKKRNDRIHPVLKGKVISLNTSEGVLLPGEGVSITALRSDFMSQCEEITSTEE